MSPLIPLSTAAQQSVADLHSHFIREGGREGGEGRGGEELKEVCMNAGVHLCDVCECIIGGVTSVST